MSGDFKFLVKLGQFSIADKLVPDGSFDELKKKYEKYLIEHNLNKARQTALKLTLQYGLEGLYLYLAIEILSIRNDKRNHEIIDQSVIQLLGLILFVENHLDSTNRLLEEQKKKCFEMIEPTALSHVQSEANALLSFYNTRL